MAGPFTKDKEPELLRQLMTHGTLRHPVNQWIVHQQLLSGRVVRLFWDFIFGLDRFSTYCVVFLLRPLGNDRGLLLSKSEEDECDTRLTSCLTRIVMVSGNASITDIFIVV